METAEKNKLIAEFMGLKSDKDMKGFYLVDGTLYNLRYHFSWDWLMPVIDKIFNLGLDEQENNKLGDITHALVDINLEATYNAVVEFIKFYNDETKRENNQ